jgi:uncharacterized protein
MAERFMALHRFLARHRLMMFVFVAALSVCGGILSTRLEMDEDIMRMLPQRDEAIGRYLHAFRKLRQIDSLVVDVSIAEPNDAVLFAAADRVFEQLQGRPDLADLSYRFELRDYPGSLRLLHENLPNLMDAPEDYAALSQSIETEAIEQRLNWLRRSLAQPQGFVVKDVARVDPIGLSSPVLKRLQLVQAGFDDAKIVEGRIVSRDGCHVLIRAMPTFPSADIEQSGQLIDQLLPEMTEIEQAFDKYKVHVAVIGGHRIGLDNSRLIRRDSGRAISVAVVAMFMLSFVAYRRRWLALITLVPPAIAAAVAGGALFFFNTRISAIAVGCGTILLGITIDYAIHVLYHIDNHAHQDRDSMAATVKEIAAPIMIGALTTLGAFLVMLFSPVESHRQIGLFAAVGVSTAALSSLLVIPFLVPLDRHSNQRPLVITRLFERFLVWRARHVRLLAFVIVAITVLALVGVSGLRIEGDISKLNGVTASTAVDQDILWDTWGNAASATTILVTAPDMQGALELNEKVADALTPLQREGAVVSCSTIASICPSLARQARNRARWTAFWTPARRTEFESNLVSAVAGKGFSLERIRDSLQVLDRTPDSLRPEDLRGTLLEQIVSQRTHRIDDTVSISTSVKLASPAHFEILAEALGTAVPEATLLNRVAFSQQVARLAKRGITTFALVVAAVDMIILFCLLGSVGLVLVTLLPIAVGLLWTAGAMGLLGVPINSVNFVFVVFIIGVGIDYSLFMVTSERAAFRGKANRVAATSGSITVCALTTICGFGVLAVAQHPALHSIGTTAFLGMFLTMLATLLTVPPCTRLVLRLSRRRTQGPKAQSPSGVGLSRPSPDQ